MNKSKVNTVKSSLCAKLAMLLFISLGLCGCNTTYSLSSSIENINLTSKLEESVNDDLHNSFALEYDIDNMVVTLKLQSGEIKKYKLKYPLVGVIGYNVLDKDTLSKLYVYLYNDGYTKDVAIVYWNENTKELILSYGEEFYYKKTLVFDGDSFKKKQ